MTQVTPQEMAEALRNHIRRTGSLENMDCIDTGADLPDWFAEKGGLKPTAIVMHAAPPKLARDDKRAMRETRQKQERSLSGYNLMLIQI